MASENAYWLEVSVKVDGEAAEAVSAVLEKYAYRGGVAIEQSGDLTDPDPRALEPEMTVKIYLPDAEDTSVLRRQIDETLYYLGRLYSIPEPEYRKLVEEDWATAWQKNYKPFRVGRKVWIQPSWLAANQTGVEEVVITLDPGMAFGTGLHPSTRMCLEALEELVSPGTTVVDIGTGSGILTIAAVGFGASWVVALDTDPVAVRTARENSELNQVSDHVDIYQGSFQALGPSRWDLIVVNILAPVIVDLVEAGLLARLSKGGRLIMSGIIEDQEQDVEDALFRAGGEVVRTLEEKDWVTIIAKQKRHA